MSHNPLNRSQVRCGPENPLSGRVTAFLLPDAFWKKPLLISLERRPQTGAGESPGVHSPTSQCTQKKTCRVLLCLCFPVTLPFYLLLNMGSNHDRGGYLDLIFFPGCSARCGSWSSVSVWPSAWHDTGTTEMEMKISRNIYFWLSSFK